MTCDVTNVTSKKCQFLIPIDKEKQKSQNLLSFFFRYVVFLFLNSLFMAVSILPDHFPFEYYAQHSGQILILYSVVLMILSLKKRN